MLLPTSYQPLRQAPADNLGGVEALWYTPADNLLHFPYLGPLPIGQLQLVAGAVWYQLVAVRGSVKLEQKSKEFGRHGAAYTQKLVGELARHTPALAAGLETMEGGRFVALYRDHNGQVQLVGTPEEPLEWRDSYTTGSQSQRNGFDWSLSSDTLRRARPYLGSWPVHEDGVIEQPANGGGDGTVELRTAGGRLLARVPAGRSIVLKSGFKLSYSIE